MWLYFMSLKAAHNTLERKGIPKKANLFEQRTMGHYLHD